MGIIVAVKVHGADNIARLVQTAQVVWGLWICWIDNNVLSLVIDFYVAILGGSCHRWLFVFHSKLMIDVLFICQALIP